MSVWTFADYVRVNNLSAEDKTALRVRARQIHADRCTEPGARHHEAGATDYAQALDELAEEKTG